MLAATWGNAGGGGAVLAAGGNAGDLGQCWRPAFWRPLGAAPAAGLAAAPAVCVCFHSGRPGALAAIWGGTGSFGGAARGQLGGSLAAAWEVWVGSGQLWQRHWWLWQVAGHLKFQIKCTWISDKVYLDFR